MRAIPPIRLAQVFVGASLTFLAMALAAPASAMGGCEHPSERPSLNLETLHLDGSMTDQAPPPKPCSGPSCSNKSAPPTTSTLQPAPRAELWGLMVEPLPFHSPGSFARIGESILERPARLATSIFHPPRLAR